MCLAVVCVEAGFSQIRSHFAFLHVVVLAGNNLNFFLLYPGIHAGSSITYISANFVTKTHCFMNGFISLHIVRKSLCAHTEVSSNYLPCNLPSLLVGDLNPHQKECNGRYAGHQTGSDNIFGAVFRFVIFVNAFSLVFKTDNHAPTITKSS